MSHQPADCVRVHIRVWSTLIQTNHVCVVSQHASGSGPPEAPNVHFDTLVGSSVWKPEICLSSSYAPCLVPEALAGLTAMMGPGLGRYHSCCARGQGKGTLIDWHLRDTQSKDRRETCVVGFKCV